MKSVRIGAILAATIAVVGAAGASSATAQDAARDTAHVTAQAKPRPGIAAAVGPDLVAPPAGATARDDEADPKVRKAQEILTKFGIPTGAVDGHFGGETARGLCAFRRIAGIGTTRAPLDARTLTTLKAYDAKYRNLREIPAKTYAGKSTYLVAHQTCQVLFYVEGKQYRRVFASSMGVYGHGTPNGSYSLGNTLKGWYCSTLYPESCTNHSEGWFASVSRYGNMYNPRQVVGAIYVHGPTSVPPYPASHGCIRTTVKDADWMYKYVGTNARAPIFVTGKFA